MINYDGLFALAKKIARTLSKGNDPDELKASHLLSDTSKRDILEALSEETARTQIEQLKAIDTNEGWSQVVSKIDSDKKPSYKRLYKTAAVIMMFISVGYLFIINYSDTTDVDDTISEISAGTDKAILRLDNGVEIALEKDESYKNDAVYSDGARLKYSKTNTSSTITYNYLTIPRGGQYQIELSDGTVVWLNADTKLKYPVAFKSGDTRTVELLYGEAYFEVSPSTKHNGESFKVLTKHQEVEVLGTAFNIQAYTDEQFIYTTLVEGKVTILVDGTSQQLSPSEQIALNLDTKQMTKSIVNVDYHIAWINGYFNFKDRSLKDIMKVLSRWYDVDIVFESKALEDVTFSGLLSKTQNIEDILNGIQNTKFINAYEIENKTITIK